MDNSNSNPNTNSPTNPVPTPPAPVTPPTLEAPQAPTSPVQPVTPTPAPTVAPQPPTETTPNMPTQSKNSGGNKVIMAVGALLILAVMVSAGVFLFANYNNSQKTPVVPSQVNYTPTTIPTPTVSSPSSQLDNLDLGDPETELNSVDQDINQL